MDISFIDHTKHRKWTYDNVRQIEVYESGIVVKAKDLDGTPFRTTVNFSEFDYVEMGKEE